MAEGKLKMKDRDLVSVRPMRAIPFLVPLHAPDLFNEDAQGSYSEAGLAQWAMAQITKAFHRAFCDEIAHQYQARLTEPKDSELQEIALQFRGELDQMPTLADLRVYWERAGYLEGGVLGEIGRQVIDEPFIPGGINRKKSQGFRELAALHTSIEAVNLVQHPEEERAREKQSPDTHEPKETVAFGLKGPRLEEAVRLGAPILSLLAGAFAANAVASAMGPITAGAIAIITVLLVYSFLRRTGLVPHDRTLGSDTSIASLDLMLPVLVERSFDAGFAPIFVVDELDKVSGDLEPKLGSLIKRLKYFVTDRAVFCFLADRSYYERFEKLLSLSAHPIQETYYADRLLVYFSPSELHEYLETILEKSRDEKTQYSRELIQYVILHQAFAHLLDLRRIMKMNAGDGHLTLEENGEPIWKVPGYRLAVIMQVAIEFIFDLPDVRRRLRQEPEFTQWISDVLYHFVRVWREDEAEVTFSLKGISKILSDRVTPPSTSFQPPAISLDKRDETYLFERMIDFVKVLASPHRLLLQMLKDNHLATTDDKKTPTRWPWSIVATVAQSPPLVHTSRRDAEVWTFLWRYDQYGRPFDESKHSALFEVSKWANAVPKDDAGQILEARMQIVTALDDATQEILDSQEGIQELVRQMQAIKDVFNSEVRTLLDEINAAEYREAVQILMALTTFEAWAAALEKDRDQIRRALSVLGKVEGLLELAWNPLFKYLRIVSARHKANITPATLDWAGQDIRSKGISIEDWHTQMSHELQLDAGTRIEEYARLLSLTSIGEIRTPTQLGSTAGV